MPLREMRATGFRPFVDSGLIRIAPCSAVVGRNDAGKSGLLAGLKIFFVPPKKGLPLSDIHLCDPDASATIEVAFDPNALSSRSIQHGKKDQLDILTDGLVDKKGFLRLRMTVSTKRVEAFEICIHDFADTIVAPLSLKSDDQLSELLKAFQVQTPADATILEKRAALRKDLGNRGLPRDDNWFDATEIESSLRSILPEFIYFTDTSDYSISQTEVQNQFRTIVERAIGGQPSAQTIEQEMLKLVQVEFDKVFQRLSRLTDAVTDLTALPKVSWKKAIEGVELRWKDESGFEAPYDRRGAGIRRLFMVAYFQYEAAAALDDPKGTKYVFAIEEPEVHLHPGAQRELLLALKALSKRGHTVLFTTHSPVFAASTPLEGITLVHRGGSSSETVQVPNLDLSRVAEELGVEAPDRLVGRNHVVLVEGPRDVEFYTVVLEELHKAGQTKLDPSKVLFLQCGGAQTMKFAVTSRSMDKAGLKWAVLGDSDRQGPGGAENDAIKDLRSSKPATCLAVEVLERTAIENYLDPAAIKTVTNVDCLVPAYGPVTDPQKRPLKGRDRDSVKHGSAKIAKQMGAAGLLKFAANKNGRSEWKDLFERLRVALGL
jgi:putative ATP-dependent endonuclease of OLD family